MVLLRIPVTETALNDLETHAKAAGKSVEDLIASRISQISQTNSEKPIVFTDKDRRQLEKLLGKNFNKPDEVIQSVERAVTLQVGEVPVEIDPQLLSRLKSRCFGMPFDKFIALTVKRQLQEFCGLR